MAFGGGQPSRGSSTWMSSVSGNQWNLSAGNQNRRDTDIDEWNQTGQNISNNLEWQSQKSTPVNNNKNKRKSNTSKNTSRTIKSEDNEEDCEIVEENHTTTFPRTKFTASAVSVQNGLNGARQKVQVFHEESTGEGDRNEANRSQKRTWHDNPKTTVKNISKNVAHAENDQVNAIISQLPNASQIIERLKQIREYMKQVAAMIDTLHKSGDHRVVERKNKLQNVYCDLQSSEQQLLDLLNKLSRNKLGQIVKFTKLMNHLESQENECLNVLHQFVEIHSEHGRLSDEKSESSSVDSMEREEYESGSQFRSPQLTNSAIENDPKILDSAQLAKRNELLQKVAESQEKLKALQDQQATLIALQRKAENRLAQAKARSNQCTNTQTREKSPVENETVASHVLQDDLESLQDRLNALKDLYDNRQRAESMSRSVETDDRMEECEVLTEIQRQELQNKLQDLQEKKNYMDSLLQELKSFPAVRSHEIMNNNEMFSEKIKDGASASCVAKHTIENAQEILESIESNEKFGKLKEMKHRLRHLQDLLAQYQTDQVAVDDFLENSNSVCSQSSAIARPAALDSRRKQNEKQIIPPRKNDNLNRNDIKCGNNTDNNEKDESDEDRLDVSSDENEAQEQLQRLKLAKDKLCRLQDLLSTVSEHRQGAGGNMDVVQQLLENLDKDDENPIGGAQGISNEQLTENSAGENKRKERKRRSGLSVFQSQEPSMNIENFIAQGHALLENQEQFTLSQKHPNNVDFAPNTATNRPFEQTRLVAGKSETRPQQSKYNDGKQSVRPKYENKNSVQNIGEKRIPLDTESGSGELMTSNQEIWSEVRQRFILREELRQKKRELEELMKKDKGKTNSRNQDNMSDNVSYSNKSEVLGMSFVGTEGTTVATWGGSTQGNLDEDQEDQNESQEEVENENEEEIEECSTEDIALASNVASGRNDIRFMKPKGTRVDTAEMVASGEKPTPVVPKSKSESKVDGIKSWDKVTLTRDSVRNWNNHSNLRQPDRQNVSETEEHAQPPRGPRPAMTPTLWQQQAYQFMQQLEQTNILHHSIMRDQSYLTNLLHQMNVSAVSPSSDSFRPQFPEMFQHMTHQLQHQQQLVNLHQCHHLLYLQQMEIQQLQRQMQQMLNMNVSPQNVSSEDTTTQSTNANQESDFNPLVPPAWFSSNHLIPPSAAQMRNSISDSGNNLFSANFLPPDQLSPGSQTLNNQVAPGIRTNNYWDNFRSYSRQNLLSAASGNKSSSGNEMLNPGATSLMQNRHIFSPHAAPDAVFRPRECATLPALQRHAMVDGATPARIGPAAIPKLDLHTLTTKSKPKKDKVNENNHQTTDGKSFSTTQTSSAGGLCEQTAGNDVAKSCVSGGNVRNANTTSVSSSSAVSLDSFVRDGMAAYLANSENQRCVNAECEELHDRSLFESMRESIYSEVAVLISQNETRPQFLIQIFKELQKLNSDYLRQNALSLLSDFINRISGGRGTEQIKMPFRNRRQIDRVWANPPTNPTELTTTESVVTSDEDEIRARLFKMSKPVSKTDSMAKSTNQKIHGQHVDYAEGAENGDSYSTAPTSTEQPFTSSVAETLLQVNKIKEVNQQKQKSLPLNASTSNQASGFVHSISEETNSSTQDGVSEISCEIPYSEMNPKQLDDRIQSIMLEVIPFLKAHLDDVCSLKLLTSLQQLIIYLVSERDEAMELTSLFRKRLTSSLQMTLSKYTGKRLRDCGEDLLVDTSEVLFGELAFVHLVRNVDTVNSARGKMRTFQTVTETFSTLGNSNEGSPRRDLSFVNGGRNLMSSAFADVEATDADECVVSKMDDEELGQSRDDSMAAKCDIFDIETGSRPSSMNSFKENNSQVELERSTRARECSPIGSVSPNGAGASSTPVDLPIVRQEQISVEQQNSIGENDNEIEEGLEDNLDLAEADQPQNLVMDRPNLPSAESGHNHELIEEAAGTEATEDDQLQGEAGVLQCTQNESIGAEGGVEQGLDEVPIKLLPLFQRELNARRAEEESQNDIVDEILNDSVEAELAENFSVRQPDSQ